MLLHVLFIYFMVKSILNYRNKRKSYMSASVIMETLVKNNKRLNIRNLHQIEKYQQ